MESIFTVGKIEHGISELKNFNDLLDAKNYAFKIFRDYIVFYGTSDTPEDMFLRIREDEFLKPFIHEDIRFIFIEFSKIPS